MPSDQQELTDAKNYTRERWKQFKAENRKLRQENDELRAALASLPDRTGEPVAWRYYLKNQDVWVLSEDAQEISELQAEFPDVPVTPLYAAPDAEQARLRERVMDIDLSEKYIAALFDVDQLKTKLEAAEDRLAQAERAPAVTDTAIDRFYESLQSQPNGSAYPPRQHVRVALQAALAEPQQAAE